MSDSPHGEEKSEDVDGQRAVLFAARRRGLLALGGTTLIAIAAIAWVRTCSENLPDAGACKTNDDCEGALGVECLHAPTRDYCTHSCIRNDECDKGFHCEAPAWEKNTTRLLCLKDDAPRAM